MDDVITSPLFQGSAWVLTLAGTLIAAVTLFQVRNKDSAFRRALTTVVRHRGEEAFSKRFAELREVGTKILTSADPGRLLKLTLRWQELCHRVRASVETSSVNNPLALSVQPLTRWEPEFAGWNAAVAKVRRNSSHPPNPAVPNPAEMLLALLKVSSEKADDYVQQPSDVSRLSLQDSVGQVLKQYAYMDEKYALTKDGDLHDDR